MLGSEKFDKELKKIYKRLINEGERGFNKEWEAFLNDNQPAETAVSWVIEIRNIKKKYGLGPSVIRTRDRILSTENIGNKQKWWEKKKAHISKDKKYYVVPLVFNNFTNNSNITKYSDEAGVKKNDKYIIGEAAPKGSDQGGKGLLGIVEFVDLCTKEALKKLGKDLNKALKPNKLDEWSETYGCIPQNRKSNNLVIVDAWNIVPRRPNYQNLQIKVLFDRGWVNSLPNKSNPNIDYSITNREVMILVKDLKKYLDNLERILRHFDVQIQLALLEDGVETSFNASCAADRVTKIYDTLDGLLRTNDKGNLKDLEESNAALQFGFTKNYVLQYIAYSEEPDCLCDKNINMNAYALREGLYKIKGTYPFSSPTVNNFVHLLPEINRRYSKHLDDSGTIGESLFGTQQSWLNFLNTYVYPQPDIHHHGAPPPSGPGSGFVKGVMGLNVLAKNPLFKDIASGKYIKDPLQLMSPEIKQTVVASSNIANLYYGDDAVMNAMFAEIKSMTSLYDNLLNKIPVSELIKMASVLIFKCLPMDEAKLALCKMILKTLPMAEIKNSLYPCLRELDRDSGNSKGAMAIALLEGMVSGRMDEVYKIASARYPDKFPVDHAVTMTALGSITSLYCSDPHMQNMLGRSPDDFSDELAKWAEDEAFKAVCDCILTIHDPVSKLLDISNDIYDDVSDGMATGANKKVHNLEKENTLALDRILTPIKQHLSSRDTMIDFGKSFAKGLQDMAMSLLYASVMVVLKYVREEVLGSLAADICNKSTDSPFNFANPKDWIMKSPLYMDKGQQQFWDMMEDYKLKNYWNTDIQSMVDGFERLGEMFSPRELKLLFTTPCKDNSLDDKYEQASAAWISELSRTTLDSDFPGLSTSEIAAETNYDPTKGGGNYTITDPLTGNEIWKTLPGDFISSGQTHDICNAMANYIPDGAYDSAIEEWDLLKNQFAAFCDDSDKQNELAESLDPDEIKNLAQTDTNELVEDMKIMFPLLDKKAMQDMYPPLFCGPCAPNQVGMKPLMPSQFHPTQRFMFDRINEESYKVIDNVFNTNLTAFKSIINEDVNSQVILEMGKKISENMDKKMKASDAAKKYDDSVEAMLSDADAATSETEASLTAETFRKNLIAMTSDEMFMNQLSFFDPSKKQAVFTYKLPNSYITVYMVFNFSEIYMTWNGNIIAPSQIKLYVYNSGIKEYEFPTEEEIFKETKLKDFNPSDLLASTFAYFHEAPNASKALALQFAQSNPLSIVEGLFPIASNLILETVWKGSTLSDLFSYKNFNSLPLTNLEVQSKCNAGTSTSVPLLDPARVQEQVGETTEVLECVTSMFDNPDAVQISNLYGLYKLLIKVCVVEELLKNIFIFGWAKISDIVEDPSYMALVISNVKHTTQAALPDGFDTLKKYSAKIINARTRLLDQESLILLSEEEQKEAIRTKTGIESVEIIIKEVATEVDLLFDSRVREFVDPNWRDKFGSFQSIDPEKLETYFNNNFFKYAISPDLILNTRYPSRKYIKGGNKDSNEKYQLENKTFPSFELAGRDINYHWSTEKNTPPSKEVPHSPNYDGGLFLEPYIRMTSVFENNSNESAAGLTSNITENMCQKFFLHFTTAWMKFKERTYRAMEDENYEKYDGMHTTFAPDIMGSPWYAYPRHAMPIDAHLDTSQKWLLIDWVDSLVTKVGVEMGESGKILSSDTFKVFFSTFFTPLTEQGIPKEKENSYFGSVPQEEPVSPFDVFERLVGSFVHNGETKQTTAEENKQFGSDHNENGPFAPIAGTPTAHWKGWAPNWMNSFFYWEHFPHGVIPAASNHFRNRGVIGWADASLGGGFNYLSGGGMPGASAYKDAGPWKQSTIATFAHAKETSLIGKDVGAYATTDTNKIASGGYLDTDVTLLANIRNLLTIIAPEYFEGEGGYYEQFIKDKKAAAKWGLGETKEDAEKAVDAKFPKDVVVSPESARWAVLFYEFLKTFVLDSPYDLWFNFSIGLRLNLIVPYQHNEFISGELSTDFIENEIKKITQDSSIAGFVGDKKYNLDKVFIISSGGGNNETHRKYMCLPLEYTEHSLWDYWKDVYETGDANYHDDIRPLPGLLSYSLTGLENQTFTDSPWHDLMKNISTLGSGEQAIKYGFARTWPKDDPYRNYIKNIYFPHKYNQNDNGSDAVEGGHYQTDSSDSDFDKPTLFAACKLINFGLSKKHPHVDDAPEHSSPLLMWSQDNGDSEKVYELPTFVENETRKKVLAKLENILFKKMADHEADDDTTTFQELLPIRESIFTTALIYRYLMETSYPQLTNLFSPTKKIINSFIATMNKTIEGDYTYVNELTKSTNELEKMNSGGHNPGDIAWQFFLMIVQISANTVDPTWKTPWLFPGPLTPIGIVAKTLSRKWGDNDDDDDDKDKKDSEGKSSIVKEDCAEPAGYGKKAPEPEE